MTLAGKQGGFVPEHFIEDSYEQHKSVERYVAHIDKYLHSAGYETEALNKGRVKIKLEDNECIIATHIYDDLRFEAYIDGAFTVAAEDKDIAITIAHHISDTVACVKAMVRNDGSVWFLYEGFHPSVEAFTSVVERTIDQLQNAAMNFSHEFYAAKNSGPY